MAMGAMNTEPGRVYLGLKGAAYSYGLHECAAMVLGLSGEFKFNKQKLKHFKYRTVYVCIYN